METSTLLWGVIISSIGVGFLIYGKRQKAPMPLISGFLLLILPYLVANSWVLVALALVLMAVPYFVRF